jgi:hypothetical protein
MSSALAACFKLINTDFFGNFTLQIQRCEDPLQLQQIINDFFAELSTLEGVLEGELLYLLNAQGLLTIPTSPTDVLTWVSSYITNVLTPFLKPIVTITAQVAQIASLVETAESAIQEVINAKFPDASILIPTVTISCTV